jgi:hypothetical protein
MSDKPLYMKTILPFAILFVLLTLHACQQDSRQSSENETAETNTEKDTPKKLIESLVGEWQSDTRGGQSSQAGRAEGETQRLIFTEEARYIRYSGNEKVDSGAYRMNEQLHNLYLESEANEEPREFEIDLRGDTLTLKPKSGNQPSGNQAGEPTQRYRKVSSETSPSN